VFPVAPTANVCRCHWKIFLRFCGVSCDPVATLQIRIRTNNSYGCKDSASSLGWIYSTFSLLKSVLPGANVSSSFGAEDNIYNLSSVLWPPTPAFNKIPQHPFMAWLHILISYRHRITWSKLPELLGSFRRNFFCSQLMKSLKGVVAQQFHYEINLLARSFVPLGLGSVCLLCATSDDDGTFFPPHIFAKRTILF